MSHLNVSFSDRPSLKVSFGAGEDNFPSLPLPKESRVFASKVAGNDQTSPSNPSKKRKFEQLSGEEVAPLAEGQAPLKKEKNQHPVKGSAPDVDADDDMGQNNAQGISQYLNPSLGGPSRLPGQPNGSALEADGDDDMGCPPSRQTPPPQVERQPALESLPENGTDAKPKVASHASPGKKRVVKQLQDMAPSAPTAPALFKPIGRDQSESPVRAPRESPLAKTTSRFYETLTSINLGHYTKKALLESSREKRKEYLDRTRESFDTLRSILTSSVGASPSASPSPSPSSSSSSSASPARSYTPISFLGSGGMGRAFLAEDVSTGDRVAFKVNKTAQQSRSTKIEGRMLQDLQGVPGVPQFRDSFKIDKDHEVVAMELLPSNVQESCISPESTDKIQLDWQGCLNGFWQCLAAMQACRKKNIIHRDLKTENITIDHDTGIWKVADFGLAKKIDPNALDYLKPRNTIAGTFPYIPPEMILNSHPSEFQGDIWSLALTFFEVLTDEPLFDIEMDNSDEEHLNLIQSILQVRGPAPVAMTRHCSQVFKDLCNGKRNGEAFKLPVDQMVKKLEKSIKKAWHNRSLSKEIKLIVDLLDKMLKWSPRERITVSEAMRHPVFQPYLPAWIEIDPSWQLGELHGLSIYPAPSPGCDGETPVYQANLVDHPKLCHLLWNRAANDKYRIERLDGDKFSVQLVVIPQGSRIRISADATVITPPG